MKFQSKKPQCDKLQSKKTMVIAVALAVIAIAAAAAAAVGYMSLLKRTAAERSRMVPGEGEIFLYGEEHGSEGILEKEFQLWHTYYHDDGMRDLFVELPYYTAEFMNLWMRSEDDEILEELYRDWEGTAMHAQTVLDFYRRIKEECPETVFHGTDVGHQYATTGKRYLEYLASCGLEQSEVYRLAKENIGQGKRYYLFSDNLYRENKMTDNFIREFDNLGAAAVMGIYGTAHTGVEAMEYSTNRIPCMAGQLKGYYGDTLHSVNLTHREVLRTDTLELGGKEYEASYFGQVDLSAVFPEYQFREFWRLEGAYDDFRDKPVTGNVLPYDNYPLEIQTGQVFVIQYTKTDGTVITEYHRSDGNKWRGSPATEEFLIDDGR